MPERIEERVRESFVRATAEHQMSILHDDGLYRHLRFQKPGTSIYYFDLVTWPGHLVVCGDLGDYHFSRTRDMTEFFAPSGARGGFEDRRWGVNLYYWGEKLLGGRPGRAGAMSYSHDAFRAQLYSWAAKEAAHNADCEMYPGLLQEALEREVLDEHTHSMDEALERLRDVEDEIGERLWSDDAWEWDLREFDASYVWCCWAIVWGLEQHRAAATEAVAA